MNRNQILLKLQSLRLLRGAFAVYERTRFLNWSVLLRNRRFGACPDGLPLPPGALLTKVAGTPDIEVFLDGGRKAAASIRELLAKHGVRMEDCRALLDFGCGCGRVLRHWKHLEGVHGTDYNPMLVNWCRVHLPFADVTVNQLAPPLAWSSGRFELIYALSVFTHLDEPLQHQWMRELTRILAPGGHLVFSTHGESYVPSLTPPERLRFRETGLVVRFGRESGSNLCNSWHAPAYVKQQLARELDFVEHVPEGARGNPRQDLYLFRKGQTM